MNETDPLVVAIPEIQGAGHVSPLVAPTFAVWSETGGAAVTVETTGVVTAATADGFWMQDPLGDQDPGTSDAIFVATDGRPEVGSGTTVEVVGTVREIVPGGEALPLTVIEAARVSAFPVAPAIFPTSVRLGEGGLTPPDRVADDDGFASFDPETDALDFYEALEGMLVTLDVARPVAPTDGDRLPVVAGFGGEGLSERGALPVREGDLNPERLFVSVDPAVTPDFGMPEVDLFAALGPIEGVLSLRDGVPEVVPVVRFEIAVPEFIVSPRETTQLVAGEAAMTVATYRIDRETGPERLTEAAREIVQHLRLPDVIALQSPVDTPVDAETLAAEIDRLDDGQANGSAPYAVLEGIAGTVGARTALLYRTDRLDFEETVTLRLIDDLPAEGIPFGARFVFGGETVVVGTAAFLERADPLPVYGPLQPVEDRLEEDAVNARVSGRRDYAGPLNDALDALLAADPEANILLAGAIGDPGFVSTVASVLPGEEGILTDLSETLPATERYTAIEAGNAIQLDHVLASPGLAPGATVDIVHMNAEFLEGRTTVSARDPVVVSLALGEGAPERIAGTAFEDALIGTDGADAIAALGSDDVIAASAGDDLIDGGGGTDRLAYDTVAHADASLVRKPDGVLVETALGTDTLLRVERIDFADGSVLLDLPGDEAATAYRLYLAALGRMPDEAGLRFQTGLLEDGATRERLALAFVESAEFEARYGSDPDAGAYVDALYLNVFGREADEAGRAFWSDALDAGVTREAMLVAFAEGAESREAAGPYLAGGPFVPDDLL